MFSRNRGRGGVYDYFDCLSKKTKKRPCSRRMIRLEKVESAVERFYSRFRITTERADLIREGVLEELAADRDDAVRAERQARQQLQQLDCQQAKLLEAYYAGAMPIALMKAEMERLTRDKARAEQTLAVTAKSTVDLERRLNAALSIASRCDRQYGSAPPAQRRLLNQGFFKKLFIDQDGDVERFEMTEPFATLLDRNLVDDLAARRAEKLEGMLADAEDGLKGRAAPSIVSINSFTCSGNQKPGGGAVRLGLNVLDMVRQVDCRWNQIYLSLTLMYEKLDKFGLNCPDGIIVIMEGL